MLSYFKRSEAYTVLKLYLAPMGNSASVADEGEQSQSKISLEIRQVGTKCVITSPDVPELYVSGADEREAREHVQSALDMLGRMKQRRAMREALLARANLGKLVVSA